MSNAQHAEALREQVRPEDRRKHTRITLKTEVHLGSESNFYTGFTNDISEGGVFISTHAVFTRGQIIDAVRGEDYAVTERSVDVQVVGLRRKLGVHGELVETVRGVGYRLRDLNAFPNR